MATSAMKSIANATLAFGMVSIPVKMYLTASPVKFSFNWLAPSGNRIKQQMLDSETGAVIERKDILNAVEVEKDQFVILSEEEIAFASGKKNEQIELCEVVNRSKIKIAPQFIERSLFLTPDKSDRAYKVLHHSLRDTNKVAVARWFCRGK